MGRSVSKLDVGDGDGVTGKDEELEMHLTSISTSVLLFGPSPQRHSDHQIED